MSYNILSRICTREVLLTKQIKMTEIQNTGWLEGQDSEEADIEGHSSFQMCNNFFPWGMKPPIVLSS